jgi:hypothetical protein
LRAQCEFRLACAVQFDAFHSLRREEMRHKKTMPTSRALPKQALSLHELALANGGLAVDTAEALFGDSTAPAPAPAVGADQFVDDVEAAVTEVRSQHTAGEPYPGDTDGVYDCDNFTCDVSALLRAKGHEVENFSVARTESQSGLGFASGIVTGEKMWAHDMVVATHPAENNSGENRYTVIEPQNGEVVTTWQGPPESADDPPVASVQEIHEKFSQQWDDYQTHPGSNLRISTDDAFFGASYHEIEKLKKPVE